MEEIAASLPVDRIIFEAPRKDQQAWFIRRFGATANLGNNIASDEAIALSTLRLGLRSDTLDLLPSGGSRARSTGRDPGRATEVSLGHIRSARAHP